MFCTELDIFYFIQGLFFNEIAFFVTKVLQNVFWQNSAATADSNVVVDSPG